MIFTDDKRDYSPIIEEWVREFMFTMEDGFLEPGNDSGDAPAGVKIIFDGYGYNEQTNNEDDTNHLSFAVFIHETSLTEDFPPHDLTPWALIHRPKEEVCIYCWYDALRNTMTVIPFEDNNSTELNHGFVYNLISKINERDSK